jgi:hypothetical protein
VVFSHFYPADSGAGEVGRRGFNGVLEQDAIDLFVMFFRCAIVIGDITLNIKLYGLYPSLMLTVRPRLVSRI